MVVRDCDTWRPVEVRACLAGLAAELELSDLPPETNAAMRRLLDEATAVARPGGDPRSVASRLHKVTRTLSRAGGAAEADAGAIEALRATATALGPAGKTVLALLPAS